FSDDEGNDSESADIDDYTPLVKGMMVGTVGMSVAASENGRRPSRFEIGGFPSPASSVGAIDYATPATVTSGQGYQNHNQYQSQPVQSEYQYQIQNQQVHNQYQYQNQPVQNQFQYQQQTTVTSSMFGPRIQATQPPSPPAMRRNPTAPASTVYGMPSPPQSSSFVKIRAHYDGDILIIAMPSRQATIQDLRERVGRKAAMMPHKPMLSNPINVVVKEEIGFKEWRVVGVLETDEDVIRAFASNSGQLNLFLS
ncbi:UNVERIFIED_CONTAM: hypothetical protein HDU68_008196, partial [Siphonaria sp. JEL0065]